MPAEARATLVERLRYARVDLDHPATVVAAAAAAGTDAPVAVYLALPPGRFAAAVDALAGASLPAGSRVVVEKPFGADAEDAAALNALLERVTDGADGAVFRVDHALVMPGTADLTARRGPGGDVSDPDGAGGSGGPGGIAGDEAAQHSARLGLLASLRPAADQPRGWTRRARYTAGRLAGASGGAVPDYADEDGVDPQRATETYAELAHVSTLPRWEGTRFVLRTGKALGADAKAVVAHLRDDAPAVAGEQTGEAGRLVRVELDEVSAAGGRVAGEVPAYVAVLTDVLSGGSALSVDAAGSERAWRVVAPAPGAWARDEVPLLEHPAGSAGPGLLEAMLEELARARRFAELKAAIEGTPEPLLASHAAETERWSTTDGDGLERA